MNKYFEKIVNILGIIIAITVSILEDFSFEIKLLTFISILFVTIVISYIYSIFKYNKLAKENAELIDSNTELKKSLEKSNQTLVIKDKQLKSYLTYNPENEIDII